MKISPTKQAFVGVWQPLIISSISLHPDLLIPIFVSPSQQCTPFSTSVMNQWIQCLIVVMDAVWLVPLDCPGSDLVSRTSTITPSRGCIIASLRGYPHLYPSSSALPVGRGWGMVRTSSSSTPYSTEYNRGISIRFTTINQTNIRWFIRTIKLTKSLRDYLKCTLFNNYSDKSK